MRTKILIAVTFALVILIAIFAFAGKTDVLRGALTAAAGSSVVANGCPDLTSTLQLGSRDTRTNRQVSNLQRFISKRYDIAESDIVTGYFGKSTRAYIIRFQKENGVYASGVVGPLTREAIKNTCAKTPPVATSTGEAAIPTSSQPIAQEPQQAPVPDPTSSVPTKSAPTCTLATDSGSYGFGARITLSWTSSGATYAQFREDTSGRDHLWLPPERLSAAGSASTRATVYGNNEITLVVFGENGSASCSIVVPVL